MTFVSPEPFVDPVYDGLSDDAEVAVAQVEEEFFKRAADLDPRVSPSHDAVHAFLIGRMFDDIARMLEREFQLIAFHGEDAPVAAGQGAERASEMYGVCGCSQVIDQVACRNDAQSGVEQDGSMENGFVVGFPVFPVTLAHVDEIVPVFPFPDEVLQLLHVERVVEEGVMFVPLVDNPFPAGPSPDGEGCGEEVVIGNIGGNFFVVESGNHADAGIVLVTVQHFFAEAEETD